MTGIAPDVQARVAAVAIEHGPALFDAAVRAIAPRRSAPTEQEATLQGEAARLETMACLDDVAGELGEAEAKRELAGSLLRRSLLLRNLGDIEAHQEHAAQLRAQALSAGRAVLRAVAPILLAAAGV